MDILLNYNPLECKYDRCGKSWYGLRIVTDPCKGLHTSRSTHFFAESMRETNAIRQTDLPARLRFLSLQSSSPRLFEKQYYRLSTNRALTPPVLFGHESKSNPLYLSRMEVRKLKRPRTFLSLQLPLSAYIIRLLGHISETGNVEVGKRVHWPGPHIYRH